MLHRERIASQPAVIVRVGNQERIEHLAELPEFSADFQKAMEFPGASERLRDESAARHQRTLTETELSKAWYTLRRATAAILLLIGVEVRGWLTRETSPASPLTLSQPFLTPPQTFRPAAAPLSAHSGRTIPESPAHLAASSASGSS